MSFPLIFYACLKYGAALCSIRHIIIWLVSVVDMTGTLVGLQKQSKKLEGP